MDRTHAVERVVEGGVVAVVRLASDANLVEAARALARGGVQAVEVTMTTPGALDVIARARQALGEETLVGAGTVLGEHSARLAIEAGAAFLVSPTTDHAVVEAAHRAGVPAVAGALTPNEIDRAMQLDADLVKLFPGRVATPGYFADVLGPFPTARLLPTGNVNLQTLREYISAGAVAVGVGKALVDARAVAEGDWETLTGLASQFTTAVRRARWERDRHASWDAGQGPAR